MKIRFKKLRDEAKVPERAHRGDAGWDLFLPESLVIRPGDRVVAPLGFAIALPEEEEGWGWELQLRPRSGNSIKMGLTFINGVGTIDSTYRGELGVLLVNHGRMTVHLKAGQRVGQAVLSKYYTQEYVEVEELDDTSRGEGGYGSTGE